jgi:hypothetical protein
MDKTFEKIRSVMEDANQTSEVAELLEIPAKDAPQENIYTPRHSLTKMKLVCKCCNAALIVGKKTLTPMSQSRSAYTHCSWCGIRIIITDISETMYTYLINLPAFAGIVSRSRRCSVDGKRLMVDHAGVYVSTECLLDSKEHGYLKMCVPLAEDLTVTSDVPRSPELSEDENDPKRQKVDNVQS